jgi:bacterioferritin-associated ferredoxin
MIVCVCRRVSDRDIVHAVRGGCASFDELQDHLRVGTACGACGECARDTFNAQRCTPMTAAVSWLGRRASLATTPQPAGMG